MSGQVISPKHPALWALSQGFWNSYKMDPLKKGTIGPPVNPWWDVTIRMVEPSNFWGTVYIKLYFPMLPCRKKPNDIIDCVAAAPNPVGYSSPEEKDHIDKTFIRTDNSTAIFIHIPWTIPNLGGRSSSVAFRPRKRYIGPFFTWVAFSNIHSGGPDVHPMVRWVVTTSSAFRQSKRALVVRTLLKRNEGGHQSEGFVHTCMLKKKHQSSAGRLKTKRCKNDICDLACWTETKHGIIQ